MSGRRLGPFEYLVLKAIVALGADAYGVTIFEALAAHGLGVQSVGAIYTTLDRLEKKGMIASRRGNPTPIRGGRAKRLVQVTGLGEAAIQKAESVHKRLQL